MATQFQRAIHTMKKVNAQNNTNIHLWMPCSPVHTNEGRACFRLENSWRVNTEGCTHNQYTMYINRSNLDRHHRHLWSAVLTRWLQNDKINRNIKNIQPLIYHLPIFSLCDDTTHDPSVTGWLVCCQTACAHLRECHFLGGKIISSSCGILHLV